MAGYVKIAITVPTVTFAVVERVRRRLGKSRSAAVSLALEEWLRSIDLSDADRRYIEGYRRQPETPAEVAAWAAQGTAHWGAWEPGQPSRAAEPGRHTHAVEPGRHTYAVEPGRSVRTAEPERRSRAVKPRKARASRAKR